MQHELVIDGERFCDYEGFVREFNRAYLAVFAGEPWDGEDFNDFDDFLEAASKANGKPLTLRWINSQRSRSQLDHAQMAEYWSRCLASIPAWACSSDSYDFLRQRYQQPLEEAAAGQGRTLFEWIVFQVTADSEELVDLKLE